MLWKDLEDQRLVSEEEGKKFAEERNIVFFETSAKDGEHVQEVFSSITKAFLKTVALPSQPNAS
jgi:hypothetical protein